MNNTTEEKPKSVQEWESNFKSTLNRLSTQYLLLLRSASSEIALEEVSLSNNMEGTGGGQGGGSVTNNGGATDPRGTYESYALHFEYYVDVRVFHVVGL